MHALPSESTAACCKVLSASIALGDAGEKKARPSGTTVKMLTTRPVRLRFPCHPYWSAEMLGITSLEAARILKGRYIKYCCFAQVWGVCVDRWHDNIWLTEVSNVCWQFDPQHNRQDTTYQSGKAIIMLQLSPSFQTFKTQKCWSSSKFQWPTDFFFWY